MKKIHLNRRVQSICKGDLNDINPSKAQLKRIVSLSQELTELCDMSAEGATHLISYAITKWQNETGLKYKEGLNMSYIERLKHKTRIFEHGKNCLSQLISSPQEFERVNNYIDQKMYQYLSRLIEPNQTKKARSD